VRKDGKDVPPSWELKTQPRNDPQSGSASSQNPRNQRKANQKPKKVHAYKALRGKDERVGNDFLGEDLVNENDDLHSAASLSKKEGKSEKYIRWMDYGGEKILLNPSQLSARPPGPISLSTPLRKEKEETSVNRGKEYTGERSAKKGRLASLSVQITAVVLGVQE